MPPPTEKEYVDTNIIIECHRIGCWNALLGGRSLVTVHKVLEECATGGGRREGYVKIDTERLSQGIQILAVSNRQLTDLRLRLAGKVNLDPGEERLLAASVVDQGSWRICSPDNAL